MNALRILTIAALLAGLSGGVARAVVERPAEPSTVDFATALAPQYDGVGEYDGRLHVTISSRGIVNGYYRPDDSGRIFDVVGGLDGQKIWLEVGNRGSFVIDGTLVDGKIVGSTFLSGRSYTFTATPQAS
jgi:hypothetical protein